MSAVGDCGKGKKGTRARTAIAARAMITTTTGIQGRRHHSSKAIALTVRREFKNPRKKEEVSSWRIGVMLKTMTLVFCGGDNPDRPRRHVACRQCERMITSATASSQRSHHRQKRRIDVAGCARQYNISPWTTACQPDGGNTGQRANIDFQVADISGNVFCLGKLLRNGFVFRLNGENDTIAELIDQVRHVAADDIPVKVSSRPPTHLLDRRLDELALA